MKQAKDIVDREEVRVKQTVKIEISKIKGLTKIVMRKIGLNYSHFYLYNLRKAFPKLEQLNLSKMDFEALEGQSII